MLESVVRLVLQSANAKRVRRQPRAAIFFENFQNFFALAKTIKNRSQRANIQRMRSQPHQMRRDALQLRENCANHARPRRRFHAHQFFNRLAVSQSIRDRGHIIHAVHIRSELLVRAVLGDFFYAAMQISDDAFRADNFFAVELQLHAQHAVRGRMLRTHIDDYLVRAKNSRLDVCKFRCAS